MDIYIEILEEISSKYPEFEDFLNDSTEYNADTFIDAFLSEGLGDRDISAEAGASKLVIIDQNLDYVIKIPMLEQNYGINYCEKEREVYDEALQFGFEDFFAECIWLGIYCGVPIYLMKKMEINNKELQNRFLDGYKKSCKRNKVKYDITKANTIYNWGCQDNYLLVENLLETLDKEKLLSLIDFLMENQVNDLTEANIGFNKNGKIVFIDYSGFEL